MAIPPIAAGRITLSTVRQRATPSASAASRRVFGTSSSTSWLDARHQRQHHDRQRERARRSPTAVLGDHDQAVDEQSDDDRRQALHHVERELEHAGRARARAGELGQVEPGEDPERQRDHARRARRSRASRASELTIPPPARPLGVLGHEAEAERGRAALDHAVDDDPEHRHGEQRRRGAPVTATSRLTTSRRRRLPDGVSGAVGSNSPVSPSTIPAASLTRRPTPG